MSESSIDVLELARAMSELSRLASEHAPPRPSPLRDAIESHLGADPTSFPVVADEHPLVEQPNLQLALDAWAEVPGRHLDLLGLAIPDRGPMELSLGELIAESSWMPVVNPGPVRYDEVPVGVSDNLTCVSSALLVLTDGDSRLVCLMGRTPDHGMRAPNLHLEVIAADRAASVAFLGEIRALMIERSVYRGQVISLDATEDHGPFGTEVGVVFHQRDAVTRNDIVLADGVLERIERHALSFSQHADRLRASGRDLKRGLLLHGPAGTGKTLTVRYLTARQVGRTVVLVPGATVSGLSAACRLARQLAPATVVLEDVDLVAEERTMFGHGQNPMLAALLSEMDGVPAESDVLFILTTNRADPLEPALAARPGRVDQAVEVGLPDPECRRRLLLLYGNGVAMETAEVDEFVDRLDGVSAAFIKELMRRAVLFAALASQPPSAEDVQAALDELFQDSAALTRTLLGATPISYDDETAFDLPRGLPIPAEIRRMLDAD